MQRDPVQSGRMQFNSNIYRDAFDFSRSEKPCLIILSWFEKSVFISLLMFCLSHPTLSSPRTGPTAVLLIAAFLVPRIVNTADPQCVPSERVKLAFEQLTFIWHITRRKRVGVLTQPDHPGLLWGRPRPLDAVRDRDSGPIILWHLDQIWKECQHGRWTCASPSKKPDNEQPCGNRPWGLGGALGRQPPSPLKPMLLRKACRERRLFSVRSLMVEFPFTNIRLECQRLWFFPFKKRKRRLQSARLLITWRWILWRLREFGRKERNPKFSEAVFKKKNSQWKMFL